MNDTQDEIMTRIPPKNKGGRPRKYVPKTAVTRQSRIPLSGTRDILTVEGKDPNYHYFWAADTDEKGTEIYRLQRAGYEFVQAEKVEVGQSSVYKSHDVGSIVRVPSGDRYVYLMRIPMQWYLDDQMDLERLNKEQEQSIVAYKEEEGVYGDVKLARKTLKGD